MRKLLFESLFRRPFTEQAPSPDDAAVTELAAGRRPRRAAAARPKSLDPRGRRRILQWLRTRNPRAQQRLLRRRALRPALRRLAAPCRCADGDRPGDQEHARRAGAHLSCDPQSQMGRRGRRLRAGWRLFRRQLRGRRRRLRSDPGRPPHSRLPAALRSAMLQGLLALLERVDAKRTATHLEECVCNELRSGLHRARSGAREEDCFGCRAFLVFGFATCSLSRTPRPPVELGTPGLISSIPAFSSAETSFIRESTLPRMTPSLASMR